MKCTALEQLLSPLDRLLWELGVHYWYIAPLSPAHFVGEPGKEFEPGTMELEMLWLMSEGDSFREPASGTMNGRNVFKMQTWLLPHWDLECVRNALTSCINDEIEELDCKGLSIETDLATIRGWHWRGMPGQAEWTHGELV